MQQKTNHDEEPSSLLHSSPCFSPEFEQELTAEHLFCARETFRHHLLMQHSVGKKTRPIKISSHHKTSIATIHKCSKYKFLLLYRNQNHCNIERLLNKMLSYIRSFQKFRFSIEN